MYSATASISPLQVRHQRGHRGAHRNPSHHNRAGLRPYPSHDGADLRHRAHHARDVAQWIHVRVGRPLATSATVAGLHRHRDVEPQRVVYASDPRQHQVFCAALTGAVHPYQPRPRAIAVPAQVHHRPRRATQAVGLQRLRQRRIVFERHPLVRQPADAPPLYRLHPQRFWFGDARRRCPVPIIPRPPRRNHSTAAPRPVPRPAAKTPTAQVRPA